MVGLCLIFVRVPTPIYPPTPCPLPPSAPGPVAAAVVALAVRAPQAPWWAAPGPAAAAVALRVWARPGPLGRRTHRQSI